MQTNLPHEKATTRKQELILNFERLVDYAKNNDVSVIIIAGDMFDENMVSNSTKKYILGVIENNKNIDFIFLSGNHDEQIFSKQDVFPQNLKMFDGGWKTFLYGNIAISGTEKIADFYDNINLDKNDFNIVVLHGKLGKTVEYAINLDRLVKKNINYLALGHEHSFKCEKYADDFYYAYSGCLEGRGYDEFGEKGFILLNIQDETCNIDFIPFARRKFFDVFVDISTANNWFEVENMVSEKIKDIGNENFVKVTLVGEFDISLQKHINLLSKKLNDKFFSAKIDDQSKLKININDYQNELSLKGEFVRQVLDSEFSATEKEKIILLGLNALDGGALWT